MSPRSTVTSLVTVSDNVAVMVATPLALGDVRFRSADRETVGPGPRRSVSNTVRPIVGRGGGRVGQRDDPVAGVQQLGPRRANTVDNIDWNHRFDRCGCGRHGEVQVGQDFGQRTVGGRGREADQDDLSRARVGHQRPTPTRDEVARIDRVECQHVSVERDGHREAQQLLSGRLIEQFDVHRDRDCRRRAPRSDPWRS